MQKVARELIWKHSLHESFYIVNMQKVRSKIEEWRKELPMIKPHYAVKCNPDSNLLKELIREGIGFDCASKCEIDTVLTLGAKPDSILFMHPFKACADIEHAFKQGVKYTTFDSYSEIDKLKDCGSGFKCLMRIKVDNPTARVQLGLKYGIDRQEFQHYVDYAVEKKIDVVGTCFHVGSASKDPEVFKDGIEYSRKVFEYAKQKGLQLSVLDIGGGFTTENFSKCAKVIRSSLEKNEMKDVMLVAEPGRFFASDVFTFVTPIIGYKFKNNCHEYFIRDSLYGSFNCILYDGQQPKYSHVSTRNDVNDTNLHTSLIQGSTCDSIDSMGHTLLPRLQINDFIMCENFGAYTISGAKNFNGIPMSHPTMFYLDESSELDS